MGSQKTQISPKIQNPKYLAGKKKKILIFLKIEKRQVGMSTTDGRLKLNFASCVIRQTRSFGALVLYSICNVVFVN